MKRRFLSLAGMLVLGSFVVVGCAEEASTTKAPTEAAAPAPKEEAVTNVATPEVAKPVEHVREAAPSKLAAAKAMGSVCALSGAAGTTVNCAIKLAADASGVPARALQGTLLYDASLASFEGFYEEFCPAGAACVDREITAEAPTLSATGHILSQAPKAAGDWNGRGSFLIANLTNPRVAISEAAVGTDAAKKGIFTARFTLKQDVAAGAPLTVDIANVVAADEAANEIQTSVAEATIVTGAANTR